MTHHLLGRVSVTTHSTITPDSRENISDVFIKYVVFNSTPTCTFFTSKFSKTPEILFLYCKIAEVSN